MTRFWCPREQERGGRAAVIEFLIYVLHRRTPHRRRSAVCSCHVGSRHLFWRKRSFCRTDQLFRVMPGVTGYCFIHILCSLSLRHRAIVSGWLWLLRSEMTKKRKKKKKTQKTADREDTYYNQNQVLGVAVARRGKILVEVTLNFSITSL